jgi:alkylation response protein AidB-like acyl-CoA dehydrogenase
MSLTGVLNTHLILASCIERDGTEDQKKRFLPKLASGELRGGLALTEAAAGTDLQGIRTVARKDGDHYVVNGSKLWITNALEGNCTALLVKTNPKADPPRKGMSMFIAEKGDGYNVTRKLDKLGYRGVDTAEIVLEDYRISADCLIGDEEGRGFYNAVAGLELGRINIAARGVGVAKAALDESVRYSQTRKTFGKPICEHQAIQLKLGDMSTRVEAARLLTASAAKAYDAGKRCDMEAGMAKYFASEAAVENSIEAMRIFGAYGYSSEYVIERLYRDAPLLAIGEGTNEMQRIIIARQLIERNKI